MGSTFSYFTSSPPKSPIQPRLAQYVQALSPAENLDLIQSLAQGDSTKRAKCILLSDKGIDEPPFTLTRDDFARLVRDCFRDIGMNNKYDELYVGALIEGIVNQVKRDIDQSGEVLGEGIGQLLDLASILIKGWDCKVCREMVRIRGIGDKSSHDIHDKFVQAIKDLDKFGYQRECKWTMDSRRTYSLGKLSAFDGAYRSFAFRLEDHQEKLADWQHESFDEMWCKEDHAGSTTVESAGGKIESDDQYEIFWACCCWEEGFDEHGKRCVFHESRH